jgi:hypothetical protein
MKKENPKTDLSRVIAMLLIFALAQYLLWYGHWFKCYVNDPMDNFPCSARDILDG